MVGSENTYPSFFRNDFPNVISSFQLPATEREVLSSFTITECDTCAFFSTHIFLVNRNLGVRVYCRGRARSSFLSVAVHRPEIAASWICELSCVSMGDSQRIFESLSLEGCISEQGIFFTAMHQHILIVCALLNTFYANKNF